jgi:hypothetical protein
VDPDADFLFVPAEEVLAKVEREGTTPFTTGVSYLLYRRLEGLESETPEIAMIAAGR